MKLKTQEDAAELSRNGIEFHMFTTKLKLVVNAPIYRKIAAGNMVDGVLNVTNGT
jgi:hypothetical protein